MNTWTTHTSMIDLVALVVPVTVSFFILRQKLANKVDAKL